VTEGRATVTTTGELETSVQLSLTFPVVYGPPPGGLAVAWSNDDGEGLTLVGAAFTGTEPTSSALQLSFSLSRGAAKDLFSSSDGSCRVTVDRAEAREFAGSFSCTGLPSHDGGIMVDASGSFTATGS
jgi:hypothetical protein